MTFTDGDALNAYAEEVASLRSRLQEAEKVIEAMRAYADFENEERRKNALAWRELGRSYAAVGGDKYVADNYNLRSRLALLEEAAQRLIEGRGSLDELRAALSPVVGTSAPNKSSISTPESALTE